VCRESLSSNWLDQANGANPTAMHVYRSVCILVQEKSKLLVCMFVYMDALHSTVSISCWRDSMVKSIATHGLFLNVVQRKRG
jgi:hypothetical protein